MKFRSSISIHGVKNQGKLTMPKKIVEEFQAENKDVFEWDVIKGKVTIEKVKSSFPELTTEHTFTKEEKDLIKIIK